VARLKGMEMATRQTLDDGLDEIRRSPPDAGSLDLIVARPGVGERDLLDAATIDEVGGLVGDTWRDRGSSRTADHAAHPGMQITLMNVRVAALVAGTPERRALAGDQLYVDLDLSEANLPTGTRLTVGTVELEVSGEPHHGCAKFGQRFGSNAVRFVNSPIGKSLRLRGMNTVVVVGGTVRVGDRVRKLLS
jgi:MOSC domain-containing protein YiiM